MSITNVFYLGLFMNWFIEVHLDYQELFLTTQYESQQQSVDVKNEKVKD